MPVAFDNSEFQISAHQDQEAGESSHQESPSRSNLCTNAVGSASRPSVRNSPEPSTSHTRAALSLPTITLPRPRIGGSQVDEHKRLFGYRGKGNSRGKSKKQSAVQTCTLKFVCLATRYPVKPPTSVKERTALSNAGLGDASIMFDLNGDSSHCHEKILEAFPKLAESGYDLQLYDRAGENSSFCVLKHPYLPRKLKVVAGQCKIYIKPLQKDLVETESDAEDVEEEEEVSFLGDL